MPTTTNATSVRVARDLTAAVSRIRRRLREVAGTEELSPSQTSVLGVLAKGGPATNSALAATERVRPQSMAATVGVLADRGLVERRQDPADGRQQLVSLTAAGESWYHGARATRQEWLVRRIDTLLSADERRVLSEAAALMQRLTDA